MRPWRRTLGWKKPISWYDAFSIWWYYFWIVSFFYIYWIYIWQPVLIIFWRRQFCQVPLIPFVIVVIYIIIYNCFKVIESVAPAYIYFIFHMTKKGFLWCIVPAVAPSWHWLPQSFVLEQLLKIYTGVMNALVAMAYRLVCFDCRSMLFKQLFYSH